MSCQSWPKVSPTPERFGVGLDAGLDPLTAARALAARRLAEEHLHQIFEHELIVNDTGYAHFKGMVQSSPPPVVGTVVATMLRSHSRKQLHARGIGRHHPDAIARMGTDDIDALAALLGDQPWFFGERPTTTDCALWGLLAPACLAPIDTPMCRHARAQPNLLRWVEGIRDRTFRDRALTRAA